MKIKCSRCKIPKEKDLFHKTKDRYMVTGYCKACRKEVDELRKQRKIEGTIKAF